LAKFSSRKVLRQESYKVYFILPSTPIRERKENSREYHHRKDFSLDPSRNPHKELYLHLESKRNESD
jgi:hypothetical protein